MGQVNPTGGTGGGKKKKQQDNSLPTLLAVPTKNHKGEHPTQTSSHGGGGGGGGGGKPKAQGHGGGGHAGSDGLTARDFATRVLKGVGAPITGANVNALMAWMRAEGGNWENSARYNPLNTTQAMPGDAGSMNKVGVRVYTSWQQGVDATVKTLENGNYGHILSALKQGHDAGAVLNAVVASPWSSYPNGISLSGAHTYGTTVTPDGQHGGSGGGGGGGGGGSYTSPSYVGSDNTHFSKTALEQQYGAIAAALNDTELEHLVKRAVNQGWDDDTFNAHLLNTGFYKQHTDSQRNWLLLQATDPREARGELQQREQEIRQQAAALGVQLDDGDVRHIAQTSLLNSFNSTQLQTAIGAHYAWKQGHAQGQAGTLQDQFQQLGGEYGINVSNDTLQRWVRRNLTGKMTPDTVKAYYEQQAAALYPGLASQLKQGMTVADVASTYRDHMAQLLELNPDQLDVFDPTIRKALQYQPDPSKPSSLMPLWQFDNALRQDPRWLQTQGAKQSAMDTGIQILKDWGLTA